MGCAGWRKATREARRPSPGWVHAPKLVFVSVRAPTQSAGLDAMRLVRIAKQHALNDTHQLSVRHDPTYFPRIKTFARLQLTDEELAKWL